MKFLGQPLVIAEISAVVFIFLSFWRKGGDKVNLVKQAQEYASRAHAGQQYNGSPYRVHLDAVLQEAQRVSQDENVQTAAILHDVLEDTLATEQEVQRLFGATVARIVSLVTDEPGQNRKERKRRTYAKLRALGSSEVERGALLVKLADRLANVRACHSSGNKGLLSMYRKEHDAFREAVYRSGLAPVLVAELDKLLA